MSRKRGKRATLLTVTKTKGLLLALALIVAAMAAAAVAVAWYLPRYVLGKVVAEAKARGIELTTSDLDFDWGSVRLSGATAKLIGAPSFEAKLDHVDVELAGFLPKSYAVSGAQVGVSGSLPRVLLELGEWASHHPEAFDAPLVASGVNLNVAETAGDTPWLTLSSGILTRTVAGATFSAESCKLSGFELGKVGAGFTRTGGDVAIGFGDQSAQAAPLRLDASVDARGAGTLKMTLTPTKLGLLGKGFGIPLPLPDVVAAAEVSLALPAGAINGGTVAGTLTASLTGFVPPHPPELDGFVFGDVTTLATQLAVDAARTRVELSNTRVKAGKFELVGGGNVTRQGRDASVDLDLKGALPCDALAGAAAESRLGRLLGRASGRQGKRTAEALVGGSVAVEVGIRASTKDLLGAQLSQKIGVGCGLRPLSLPELLALTPNDKELKAIGDELGKKLEGIGKDLGLPPVPSGLLPKLPPLPLPGTPPPSPAAGKPAKNLAAPVPSG